MMIRAMLPSDIPAVLAIEQAVQVSPWTEKMFIESLHHQDQGWVLVEKKHLLQSSHSLSAQGRRPAIYSRDPSSTMDPVDKPRGDEICGYILVKPGYKDEADILTIAVAKHHHRKGYAQALLAFIFPQFNCLYLEVRVSNQPAIALYEKMGFKMMGKRPRYYQGEDAWVMKK